MSHHVKDEENFIKDVNYVTTKLQNIFIEDIDTQLVSVLREMPSLLYEQSIRAEGPISKHIP